MKKTLFVLLILSLLMSVSVSAESNNFESSYTTDNSILSGIEVSPGLFKLDQLPSEKQEEIKNRSEIVSNYLLQMSVKRTKLNKINENVSLKKDNNITFKEMIQIESLQSEINTIETQLEEMGINKIQPEKKSVTILSSSSSDIKKDFHQLYYDSQLGLHLFEGHLIWKNDNYSDDVSICPAPFHGCTLDIGGVDGFGLESLNRQISIIENTDRFYLLGSDLSTTYNLSTSGSSRDYSPYGLGWKFQDWYDYDVFGPEQYNAYKMMGWYYFTFPDGNPSPNTTLSFTLHYGKTWYNTSVNSFSFGPGTIGIGFSSNNNRWDQEFNVNYQF
ncbi:hypothetical protein [Marinicrinis sediminis]|uniref:DUF3373 family protein n=1 Tax=Marinicrinis sediminis TaxID=1652465 RepID=A0ABW5R8X5_9BACL